MSAWSHFAGEAWSDRPSCVDPVIRSLCISINDWLPSDADRERVIGPHFAAVGGTNQGFEMTRRRAYRCLDLAVRKWLPEALHPQSQAVLIAKLRALRPIVDESTALAAIAIAIASANAIAYAYASAIASSKANAAEHYLLPLVLELCAMGDRIEVPQVRSLATLP